MITQVGCGPFQDVLKQIEWIPPDSREAVSSEERCLQFWSKHDGQVLSLTATFVANERI